MMRWLGKLLGIEGLESVENVRLQFAASWAHQRPALVLFACALVAVMSIVFYVRFQTMRRTRWRLAMAIFRALLLALLVVVLAEPVTITHLATERSSGFPRMAIIGDRLIFAWTVAGKPSEIRTAQATLDPLAHD